MGNLRNFLDENAKVAESYFKRFYGKKELWLNTNVLHKIV